MSEHLREKPVEERKQPATKDFVLVELSGSSCLTGDHIPASLHLCIHVRLSGCFPPLRCQELPY